jgi:hypothetical protein
MDSQKSNSNPRVSKWLAGSFIVSSLLLPFFQSVGQLWFEYHSGFFISNAENQNIPFVLFVVSVVLIRFLIISSTLVFFLCVFLVLRRLVVREEYASTAMLFIISSSVLTILCAITQLMPWNRNLWNYINNIPIQTTPWSETALLCITYVALNVFIRSNYLKWEGEISKEEFEKRKQNKDILSTWALFSDGFRQTARFFTLSKPLDIYQEESSPVLVTQLTPIAETLAWHEQAKDLVSLKNPSFDFNRTFAF